MRWHNGKGLLARGLAMYTHVNPTQCGLHTPYGVQYVLRTVQSDIFSLHVTFVLVIVLRRTDFRIRYIHATFTIHR
jgi:hypothetical protein